MTTVDALQLDLIFAALADPTRRAILTRLAAGEATVMELAAPFDISLPAVSKHLKVLERAGLISRSRDAQWLRSRLEVAPLEEARRWIDEQHEQWQQLILLEMENSLTPGKLRIE